MAYNGNLPADNDYIAVGPAELRENLRALKDDKIVNAQKLQDLSPGNASGNIPVANGNLNTNLNAEKLGGNLASAFATAGHTHAVATSSSNGMMSNTDKAKLDTVAAGAEVNQNAFSNILVGSTTIQADGKTDTLEMVAGTNIALTPDATNDRLTVAVTGTVASAAACTGNAATASKLATPRTIALTGGVTGSVAFDGSANASIVTTIAGNAPTATKLATARTINGVAFDGSANITVTAAANGGNADTVEGKHASDFAVATSGIPPGAVMHFAMTTPPTGWLKANGAAVSRTTYTALFAAIGTTFGAGDGSTTFNLPDLRGEFVRGYDDGRGVDSGRAFGSSQADALQNITGTFSVSAGDSTHVSGAFSQSGSFAGNGREPQPNFIINFDASRVARTANETRPRNIALLACIKY